MRKKAWVIKKKLEMWKETRRDPFSFEDEDYDEYLENNEDDDDNDDNDGEEENNDEDQANFFCLPIRGR